MLSAHRAWSLGLVAYWCNNFDAIGLSCGLIDEAKSALKHRCKGPETICKLLSYVELCSDIYF